MKVEIKNYSLQEIIKLIDLGELQLPEFQRKYIWYPGDKKALIESIFNGYPIGSLLLLEIDPAKPMFAWSMLDSLTLSNKEKIFEKKKKKSPPKYLILDGQQRLTTLGQIVLNAHGTNSYFLKTDVIFKKWLEGGKIKKQSEILKWMEEDIEFSEIISISKFDENPMDRFKRKNRWISLTVLINEEDFQTEKNKCIGDVFSEINKISNKILADKKKLTKEKLEELENKKKELENWKEFFTNVFHVLFTNFFSYSIPSVVVPIGMSIQGVCKIFTSTNTSGIKLGAFDLCVAGLYPHDILLKQLFDEAIVTYPLINAFDGRSKTYVLQYIALSNGLNPKTAGLPKLLESKHFGPDAKLWHTHLAEINSAIECINTHCGASLDSGDDLCLTYSPILPTIAIVLNKFPINDTIKTTIKALRIQKLKAWYFSSAITNRYGEGSDNKQLRDVANSLPNDFSMLQWFMSDNITESAPTWIKEPKYQDLNTSGNGAVAKAMLSILCVKKAKDFWEEDYIVGHSTKDDIHHIFPKAALKRQIMKKEKVGEEKAIEIIEKKYLVDSKLNMTFLKKSTNREQIVDQDPKDYFTELIESKSNPAEKQKFKDNLKQHLIDEDCLNALLVNDFIKFIECRHKLFKKEFESLGVQNFRDKDIEKDDEDNIS
jgi:hypothetical protein